MDCLHSSILIWNKFLRTNSQLCLTPGLEIFQDYFFFKSASLKLPPRKLWVNADDSHLKYFHLKIRVIFKTLSSAKLPYLTIFPSAHSLGCSIYLAECISFIKREDSISLPISQPRNRSKLFNNNSSTWTIDSSLGHPWTSSYTVEFCDYLYYICLNS